MGNTKERARTESTRFGRWEIQQTSQVDFAVRLTVCRTTSRSHDQ